MFHQPHNSIGNHSYNVYIYNTIDYGLHFHKNYEIIYVMDGRADCCVNNRAKIIEKGDFVFCFSNEIHSIRSIGNARIWIGVFSEDFIHEFTKYQKGKKGVDFSFRCPPELMYYLSVNLISDELSDIFMIKSCLYALCSEYLKQIPLEKSNDKQDSLMENIAEYIEMNYKKAISLSTLAEDLGYNYCYFSKMFHRMFAMSFNEYLNIYRFNAACAMLTESELPVTDISYASGFQSIRSFNNTFKKLAGVSPGEYRKMLPSAGRIIPEEHDQMHRK